MWPSRRKMETRKILHYRPSLVSDLPPFGHHIDISCRTHQPQVSNTRTQAGAMPPASTHNIHPTLLLRRLKKPVLLTPRPETTLPGPRKRAAVHENDITRLRERVARLEAARGSLVSSGKRRGEEKERPQKSRFSSWRDCKSPNISQESATSAGQR